MKRAEIKQRLISKNPSLLLALLTIKNIRNKDFQDFVFNKDVPAMLQFRNYGPENPDKDIYLIDMDYADWGFFAYLNTLLRHLAFADRFSLTPVVRYSKNCLYADALFTDKYSNPFEQFFLPVSEVSVASALRSYSVSRARVYWDGNDRLNYSLQLKQPEIECYGKEYKKYIHLRPELQKQIDNDICCLLQGKKTLAIHQRGTDYVNQAFPGHPIPVTVEQQINKIRALLPRYHCEQIFVATDEQKLLEQFLRAFPGKVVYHKDCKRSMDGTATMLGGQNIKGVPYKNGVDVLRDVYTMAHSSVLLAGYSQVSLAARIIKDSWQEKYDCCEITDNGFRPI